SPPKTATASRPAATASEASRRASPGPPVATISACQPPRRSTSRTSRTVLGLVRAAAGLVMTRARGTLELLLPEDVEARLVPVVGGQGGRLLVRGAGRRRLEARQEPEAPGEAVLEARPDVLVARGAARGADARAERQEGLPA